MRIDNDIRKKFFTHPMIFGIIGLYNRIAAAEDDANEIGSSDCKITIDQMIGAR